MLNCLNYGIFVNERDKDNVILLYWSCCCGYVKLSVELIKWYLDINVKVKWGLIVLYVLCDCGYIVCVMLLI